ncbi:hypothetical protein ACLMJK_004910 [Lecanora helva]
MDNRPRTPELLPQTSSGVSQVSQSDRHMQSHQNEPVDTSTPNPDEGYVLSRHQTADTESAHDCGIELQEFPSSLRSTEIQYHQLLDPSSPATMAEETSFGPEALREETEQWPFCESPEAMGGSDRRSSAFSFVSGGDEIDVVPLANVTRVSEEISDAGPQAQSQPVSQPASESAERRLSSWSFVPGGDVIDVAQLSNLSLVPTQGPDAMPQESQSSPANPNRKRGRSLGDLEKGVSTGGQGLSSGIDPSTSLRRATSQSGLSLLRDSAPTLAQMRALAPFLSTITQGTEYATLENSPSGAVPSSIGAGNDETANGQQTPARLVQIGLGLSPSLVQDSESAVIPPSSPVSDQDNSLPSRQQKDLGHQAGPSSSAELSTTTPGHSTEPSSTFDTSRNSPFSRFPSRTSRTSATSSGTDDDKLECGCEGNSQGEAGKSVFCSDHNPANLRSALEEAANETESCESSLNSDTDPLPHLENLATGTTPSHRIERTPSNTNQSCRTITFDASTQFHPTPRHAPVVDRDPNVYIENAQHSKISPPPMVGSNEQELAQNAEEPDLYSTSSAPSVAQNVQNQEEPELRSTSSAPSVAHHVQNQEEQELHSTSSAPSVAHPVPDLERQDTHSISIAPGEVRSGLLAPATSRTSAISSDRSDPPTYEMATLGTSTQTAGTPNQQEPQDSIMDILAARGSDETVRSATPSYGFVIREGAPPTFTEATGLPGRRFGRGRRLDEVEPWDCCPEPDCGPHCQCLTTVARNVRDTCPRCGLM